MLNHDIEAAALQDGFFTLLQTHPLDDFLDALEEALEQKAAHIGTVEADPFRILRAEIRDLRNRDFEDDVIQ